MIEYRLAAAYMTPPIFYVDHPTKIGPAEISDLSISAELEKDILEWDEEFQRTFNEAYPPDSKFDSDEQLSRHRNIGEGLSTRLQEELGNDCVVTYFPAGQA